MENCEIEMTEESKIKMEGGEGIVQKLGKHLGKLLIILEFTGIPITESRNGSKQGYLWDLFKKLCYPIFIHCSMVYLLFATISRGGYNYWTMIDTILPILPCVMWLLLRRQTTSLKLFLAELSKITSRNFVSRNRGLLCTTNAAICFIFVYPLLLLIMRVIQANIINVQETFRILQEAIFPCTMVVLYVSICYLLLQKLRFCKKKFHEKLDLTCSPDVENMLKDYLDVAKSVDSFENLLNNIAFVLVLQDFLIVTILVIDVILIENFLAKVLLEALCELLFVFVSLGIMSRCAGNVSLEVAAIKSVLLEKMFTQVEQDISTNNEKRINLLLKKDICTFTAGKILVFDRGFLLKVLFFVLLEVVFVSGCVLVLKY